MSRGECPSWSLLTPAEAAARLHVSVSTLERWRRQGRGPAWRRLSRGTVRYQCASVQRFAERHGHQVEP